MSAPRTAFERNYEDQHDPWLHTVSDPLGVEPLPQPRRCKVTPPGGVRGGWCNRPLVDGRCPVASHNYGGSDEPLTDDEKDDR